MANINPKLIGDITYDQEPFFRVITLPIKVGLVITKGKLLTIDTAGRLVAIGNAVGGVVPVTLGIFQPLVEVTVAPTIEDTDFVQVATMGSRILMKSVVGLTVGNPVKIDSPTATTTDAERVEFASRIDLDRLGTVFEIYTRDTTTEQKKQVTAVDDLVIVESGMF